jgi:ATP-dependent Clp protease ATP-binding subunit ClpA
VRITVEKKETGETGLKLESLADEAPVKPKREPEEAPKVRKAPAKKAAVKKTTASSKPASRGKDGGKRSLVPQLPRKN